MMTVGVPRVDGGDACSCSRSAWVTSSTSRSGSSTARRFGVEQGAAAELHLRAVRDRRAGADRVRGGARAHDARLRDLRARRDAAAQTRAAVGAARRRCCRSCSTPDFASTRWWRSLIAALYGVLVTRPREIAADAERGLDPRRRRRRAGRHPHDGDRHAARCGQDAGGASRRHAGDRGARAAHAAGVRRRVRAAEPARALPRTAQPVRRRHRRLHRAGDAARAAAGRAGRRGNGGRAGAERVRSDQHAERVGGELHRRRRRAHHAARAAVSSRRRDAGRAVRRRVRPRAARAARRSRRQLPSAAGLGLGAPAASNGVVAVVAGSPAAECGCAIRSRPRSSAVGSRCARCASRTSTPSAIARVAPYASILRVSVQPVGRNDDVGLELFDCAGWSVDEWHAQGA